MKKICSRKFNEFPRNQDDFGFYHYRDGVKIFIGDFRQDDFFNLLRKIVDHDFEKIVMGEIWVAEDLLTGYQENINTLKE